MSQWAEIRHLHLVEKVPKKEIARRLKLDVKTVRRAISRSTTPVRVSPPRPGTLDPWRERIRQWLREEPRLTAKTDSSVVAADGGTAPGAHGAPLRRGAEDGHHEEGGLRAPQRAARHNDGGRLRRVVGRHRRRAVQGQVPGGDSAVLQRVLRQGVPGRAARVAARRHRVGVPLLRGPRGPPRSRQHLAGGQVKDVLAGRDRVQTEAFDAFRGGYPFRAEFCAPAKGWEKGSVEEV